MRQPPTRCTDCERPLQPHSEVRINADPYCPDCAGKAAERIGGGPQRAAPPAGAQGAIRKPVPGMRGG
jgi:hypothetical protein